MNYKTLIFDCDGVIINSNHIKSQAFYKTVLSYGHEAAIEFKKYHIKNGGVSRFEKFKYFIDQLLKSNIDKPKISHLLKNYSDIIRDDLIKCDTTPELKKIKNVTAQKKWIMISGSKETELKDILEIKKIAHFFESGIFGSPDNKIEIFNREINKNNILFPAIFFGDSKYDYEVAKQFNIDFVFVSDWTEFKNYKKFFSNKDVEIVDSIKKYFKI